MMIFEWISLAFNFILGSGLLGVLVFYRSKCRREAAEASSAEIHSRSDEFSLHRESIEFLSSQLREAWGEVDKLQTVINTKRDEILLIMRRAKELEVDLVEQITTRRLAELSACDRMGCPVRIDKVQSENNGKNG